MRSKLAVNRSDLLNVQPGRVTLAETFTLASSSVAHVHIYTRKDERKYVVFVLKITIRNSTTSNNVSIPVTHTHRMSPDPGYATEDNAKSMTAG